jgi:hypothetical protein
MPRLEPIPSDPRPGKIRPAVPSSPVGLRSPTRHHAVPRPLSRGGSDNRHRSSPQKIYAKPVRFEDLGVPIARTTIRHRDPSPPWRVRRSVSVGTSQVEGMPSSGLADRTDAGFGSEAHESRMQGKIRPAVPSSPVGLRFPIQTRLVARLLPGRYLAEAAGPGFQPRPCFGLHSIRRLRDVPFDDPSSVDAAKMALGDSGRATPPSEPPSEADSHGGSPSQDWEKPLRVCGHESLAQPCRIGGDPGNACDGDRTRCPRRSRDPQESGLRRCPLRRARGCQSRGADAA